MSSPSRTIPRSEPALVFDVELRWPGGRALESPVVSGGSVFLVGQTGQDWTLAALDASTGAEREQWPLGAAVAVSRPAVLGNALVLTAARAKRVDLLFVRPGAPPEAVDAGRYQIRPSLATPVVAPDGSVSVAWQETAQYEPGSYDGVLVDAQRRILKRHSEWPLIAAGGVHVGEQGGESPNRGAPMLLARSPLGEIVWRREIHHLVSTVATPDAIFVLDRGRRSWNVDTRQQLFAQPRGLDAAAGRMFADYFEYIRTHPLFTHTLLTRLDPATGEPSWTREVAGDVTSVVSQPHALALVAADESGAGSILIFGRDGEPLGRAETHGRPYGHQWPPDPESWPRIIAVDHTRILLADGQSLIAMPLADPGRIAWKLALPSPGTGFGDRDFTDVFATPAICVSEGRIFLREGPRLWSWAEDAG
jgi:outer membrane protein assembly factor BamB